MKLMDLFLQRRSVRKFTDKSISDDVIEKITAAGLLAPSSRNLRSAELIVVTDKGMLKKLSKIKASGSAMIADAACAVAVIGNSKKADAWIEDCSLAMIYMQLAAEESGLGSCWVQCRGRVSAVENDGGEKMTSDEYARKLLNFPEGYSTEAVLALGYPAEKPKAHTLDEMGTERLHKEKFN